ncbi:TnsA-like heteromeric transposase endonuclease subunit [Corynebacterium variabile]|uniref:TnsA-like heteromeric transposase endonuclease subunit n=1 Tax=Corynebacterium variabile TaxID=1727 RepID=UPI003FCFC74B
MTPRQLPVNITDQTRVLINFDGDDQNVAGDAALADVPVERAQPLREFFAWKHKRNYEGYWYSTTVGAHVRFESLLERQFLLSADFNPSIVAISAQPLGLLWPANTTTETTNGRPRALRSHVPDFFCRHADGEATLVDVRRPDHANDPHFRLTAELCAEVGWHYTVFTGLRSPTAETLDWLAGYRMDRFAPAPGVRDPLIAIFDTETSLRPGVHAASRTTGLARDVVLGNVLHLLFHGELHFDPLLPLTMESTIRRHQEVSP